MEIRSSHFRSRYRLAFGGLLVAFACILRAQAQTPPTPVNINDGNAYNITAPLDNGNADAYIGDNISGNTLTITAPGTLTGVILGYIGNASTSDNNVVTVTGIGATWNLSSYLYIGNVGSFNSLTIANGASVTNVNGIIGNDPLANNNSVRVTGNGSIWDNGGGDVFVGNSGYANSLAIDAGGQVYGGYGFIGTDPLTGVASNNSVRVSGASSIWHNSADLYVGYLSSSNSLIIDSGGMVSNNFGFIGFDDGSFGSSSNKVLVTGAGSVWSNAADLVIGHGNGSSSNSLTIAAGGVVFNNYATIGKDFTANNNTVLVTGSGSIWTNSFDLYIGETGSFNSLTIASSGMVFSANGTIGSDANAHNNMAVVTGAGSSWINNGDLWIGWRGSYNSLIITSSGLVANANGYIGDGTNAGNNSVVVANGAVWSGGNLFVGNNGFGNSVVITNGGQVSYNNSYVGRTTFASNNSALVSGSGSIWTNSGEIRVGDFGSSNSLTIANSGVAVDGFGYIGAVDGASNNSALVSGSGSIWGSTNGFAVGYGGSFNSLVITNGGVVLNATTGGVGILSSAVFNSALISGSGSAWSNASGFAVGYFGSDNQLTINSGGQLASGDSSIGGDAGATNNVVLVTGSGSRWMVGAESGSLNIGEAGSGNSLTIANGGQVVNTDGFIGNQTSANNNSVLVTDSNSLWTNSGNIYLGLAGSFNQLTIVNTGIVVNSMGFIGYDVGASNNSALVSGNGSIWGNTNGFGVGYGGSFNSLIITNGGMVINATTGGVGILAGANYNTALISGGGSVWSNGQGFAMGLFGKGNRLTINDSGRLVTSDASFGENDGANSNVVMVTDPGSVWRNSGDMTIGFATVGNQLIITNGGKVRVLGTFRLGTNSSLLNSAMLYVGGNFENAATNQAANNFSGTNIFNGSSGGGSWNVQNVEVASAFAKPGLGAATNFYFGTVLVGDAASGSNAWVRLVDNQINTVGGGNETFGASNVVIALAQSVLDLNNQTSFVWNLSNTGTILQTNSAPPGVVTRLDIVNTFTNSGSVIIGNGSVLQFSNAFVNAGVVELLAGGVLTNFVGGGVLTNNSSIAGDGLIAALIRNAGTITATGGTLRLSAGFDDGTLGNPVNAGVLQAIGAGATLDVVQSFINTGTIAITNAAFSSLGLVNQNIVRVDNQSTAAFNGAVTNAAGASIRVSNQSLLQFNGSVVNHGTLSLVNPSTAIITGVLTLGPAGILSMPQTNNVLILRSNFINGSTNNMDFDTRYGTVFFGGSTPLAGLGAATNTFEVASTNRGSSLLGFDHNFAVGTLNITNHVQFVNNINNGGGLGTNEALYVDVLHLFDGATIKLSQLTLYVGVNFVDEATGQTFNSGVINEGNVHNFLGFDLSTHVFLDSGGQIVFVPEPSSAALLLMGAGFAWSRRRRRARRQ